MRSVFLTCLIVITVPGFARAADVQVNIRTSGAQANTAVAAGAAGGSVVVWSSYYSTSGQSNDILARRLDARGEFLGEEFRVNQATAGNQTEPAVALSPQGHFAVAWQGPGPDQEDILLRLFEPNGAARTDELLVNLATAGRQLYPSVAIGGTGTLVVAWESREPTTAGDRSVVRVQLFDPNGSGLGGEVLVDADFYGCRYPDVAMDGAGRFAVTWMRDRSIHPILVRLFDIYGVPLTDPLEVNTASIVSVTQPSIAMNTLGCFLVAWDGDPKRASEDNIYARFYHPNGQARGEPFLVNVIVAGTQQWPQAAINDANEFVLVWEHDTGDPNAAATEIAARRFDHNGVPMGSQFQLNTHTLDQQRYPDVAMFRDGSFLTTWESNGQDGSGYGIFARREPAPPPPDPNQPN
jgi:hypothetical protein